jgi:hypothetical protein
MDVGRPVAEEKKVGRWAGGQVATEQTAYREKAMGTPAADRPPVELIAEPAAGEAPTDRRWNGRQINGEGAMV